MEGVRFYFALDSPAAVERGAHYGRLGSSGRLVSWSPRQLTRRALAKVRHTESNIRFALAMLGSCDGLHDFRE